MDMYVDLLLKGQRNVDFFAVRVHVERHVQLVSLWIDDGAGK